VDRIRDKYGGRVEDHVDAIVGSDSGFVFPLIIAMELQLPYIPMHEFGEVPADSDDVFQTTYVNRKNKVNFLLYICRSVVIL